ncbi:MAG: AAA family ATPase [Myxococcaceae bacterium]
MLVGHEPLQLIHDGLHKVYRGSRSGQPVVVKMTAEPFEADALASLLHEYELLRDLDLAGIVKVVGLARSADGVALISRDAGRQTLAQRLASGPLPLAEFLEIAVQLAEAVARLHRERIVHRDIGPANAVWNTDTRTATLVDFGIATTLSALRVESSSPALLEGTLEYISPEQTGRTGRSVDSRTDLYSLGATFYEMLTGAPPFNSADPIELVHAHLARRPRPPHEVNPKVPPALSELVLKLLEKEPERRYQTAEALAADLTEARRQLSSTGTVTPFPLAHRDVPRELTLPDKLYGRAPELAVLQSAFERVCEGGRELILVTGAPGIGKSALVRQLDQVAMAHHGRFVAGKFDQLQRSVPFSGLAQALRALVRDLLSGPEAELSAWRERLQAAVTPNGQVLIEAIPELERILGSQPQVSELGPVESRNRFHLVFTSFLRAFAREDHPLALFLDDLQWVDAASLQLLEQLLGDRDCQHLLLLGAYRDTEVGATHRLTMAMAQMREAHATLHEIHLGPIGRADVEQLLIEALDATAARAGPLAELLVKKSGGNPFFVRRLLHAFQSDGSLHFEPQRRRWEWDLAELARAPSTDNVLDLMAQAIDRLPQRTQVLLQTGACIGHRFDLATLAEVSGLSRSTATDELWPALQDGLLVPLRRTYKAPRHAGALDQSLDALPARVQFVHDRVQQAAYSQLPAETRQALHLAIGRSLLESANGKLDERLFEVVDQLNLGEALITAPAERLRLAELNVAAGRKAKASAAYQAAFDYLTIARRLTPAGGWEQHFELTFTVHRELGECAYLTGRHAEAEKLLEAAIAHAPTRVAKVDLYSLRVLAATVGGDSERALRWGREGLAVFGLEWPLEGLAEAIEAEAALVMKHVGSRKIEALATEPEATHPETLALMRLVSLLGPPAYFSGSEVLPFLVIRGANLSLEHGPSAYSAYAYVFYGALHNARTAEYEVGYAFGKLALALAARFGNRAEECRTLEVFGLVVHPWKAPLRESIPLMREGFRAGVESGELAYAAFNLTGVLINGLPSGAPLANLHADAGLSIDFATRHKNQTGIELSLPFRQSARALMGQTRSPSRFDDDGFQEATFLEQAKNNQTALGQYWVARLQVAYLAGDYPAAAESSREAARVAKGVLGMVTSAEHVFYTALTVAAGLEPGTRAAGLEELREAARQLGVWAGHCPRNFRHQQKLLEAEIERVEGSPWQAMKLYREAIEGAQAEGFIQVAAVANELAARFFLGSGEPGIATGYLRAAADAYRRWGAVAKVRALAAAHPGVIDAGRRSYSHDLALDTLGLIKASQAISAEIAPSRLLERILRIVMEVAGAENGALLLCEPGSLVVRARAKTDDTVTVTLVEAPLSADPKISHAIARSVARLKEPLVLGDAAVSGPFAGDPQVRALGLRSVLCVPLKKQAEVMGLLYLENNALADAFTPERVEVIQVLAAQAAISLESSTLLLEHERLYHEAQAAVRLRDEFLAIASHELKTPLTPLRLQLQMLGRRLPKLVNDPQNARWLGDRLGTLNRQGERLERLVDQMLDISRIAGGRLQLEPEPVDLTELVRQVVARFEEGGEVARYRASIATDAPVPVTGRWDRLRLEQVITNLLSNALKYGDARPVEIAVTSRGDQAVLSVTDHGIGIAPEHLERIFKRFERAVSSRHYGGFGLGLYIAQQVVEAMGGTISVRSHTGQGSTFEVRLPAQRN